MNESVYEWVGPTGVRFRELRHASGTYYRDAVPPAVVDALENARDTGAQVRMWYGDRETGRDWLEENGVCGRIGRSMGPLRIPILLASSRSHGGGAVLCDCIVRMMVGGREVYRHPRYVVPSFSTLVPSTMDEYGADVLVKGKLHARFKTEKQAARWVAFMRGERMGK